MSIGQIPSQGMHRHSTDMQAQAAEHIMILLRVLVCFPLQSIPCATQQIVAVGSFRYSPPPPHSSPQS